MLEILVLSVVAMFSSAWNITLYRVDSCEGPVKWATQPVETLCEPGNDYLEWYIATGGRDTVNFYGRLTGDNITVPYDDYIIAQQQGKICWLVDAACSVCSANSKISKPEQIKSPDDYLQFVNGL